MNNLLKKIYHMIFIKRERERPMILGLSNVEKAISSILRIVSPFVSTNWTTKPCAFFLVLTLNL